eukprot:Em0911g1a
MEVAMSLYSSKLVGVVMMADETRTSYMTQREGDKGTRDTARNTPTNVPRAHPVEEKGPRIS